MLLPNIAEAIKASATGEPDISLGHAVTKLWLGMNTAALKYKIL